MGCWLPNEQESPAIAKKEIDFFSVPYRVSYKHIRRRRRDGLVMVTLLKRRKTYGRRREAC